jgi:plastocyanin
MLGRVGLCSVAAALVLAGCGSSDGPAASSQSSSSAATSSAGTSQPAAQGLSVDIKIADGTVTPTNTTVQAKIGEPITLHVDSDAADELHVHSVPDHEFEVEAKPGQTFDFTVDVPGSVEVELHHLNRTVATIQVRP